MNKTLMLSEEISYCINWMQCWISIKGYPYFDKLKNLTQKFAQKQRLFFSKHLINAWLNFTNNEFPLIKDIFNWPILLILKPDSALAVVILIISTFSHWMLSLINIL